mgnify:FL=1
MAITMTKALTAAAYGGLDAGLEMWDEKKGKTEPFKRMADYGRIGGVVAGFALDWMRNPLGEPLFYASLPLVEKTVRDLATKSGGGTTAALRRVSSPVVKRVSLKPSEVNVSAESPAKESTVERL